MVADFYTMPLQGKLFQKMQRFIMGWCTLNNLYKDHKQMPEINMDNKKEPDGMKECVGTREKACININANKLHSRNTHTVDKNTVNIKHISHADVV
mmetsp:Transcript_16980/g.24033  ORF Transcript_16980/g.24033 Transcript_16980/m.24033 type:complete len:96 (+) Transcript_16980:459-746(+)